MDYLIKPFCYERFEEALDKVVVRRKVIESGMAFTQADIDEMIRARRPNPDSRTAELEKGIQRQTLNHIRAELRTSVGVYRTAEQIAADTGLSKVKVRRYLNYLIGTGGKSKVRWIIPPEADRGSNIETDKADARRWAEAQKKSWLTKWTCVKISDGLKIDMLPIG